MLIPTSYSPSLNDSLRKQQKKPTHLYVCVFTGLRDGQYDRIMRWWSSNLGQELLQS